MVFGATADGLVAIRDKRVSVGSANEGGVFFDPRDVGRPICFRLLPTGTMPADALLGLLDLTLPPGLILIIEGPEVMPGGRSFRVPLSVTSVSVFALPSILLPCEVCMIVLLMNLEMEGMMET